MATLFNILFFPKKGRSAADDSAVCTPELPTEVSERSLVRVEK